MQLSGIGVDLLDCPIDGVGDCWIVVNQLREHRSKQLAITITPRDISEIRRGWRRELLESIGEVVKRIRGIDPRRRGQDEPERPRPKREDAIIDSDYEVTALVAYLKLAGRKQDAILIRQNRQQHHVVKAAFRRFPINVEERGKQTGRPILQNVPPPWILPAGDRHVIGDDIQQLAHAVALDRGAHPRVTERSAQLFVGAGMIDNVIAVGAARRSLKIRRAI